MTVSRKKTIKNRIKEIVKHVWVSEIKNDYENNMLIGDDSFKNAFYFHLRKYLEYEIKRDNLRIYTDYHIRQINEKAEIVVAHLNNEKLNEMRKKAKGEFYNTMDALEIIAVFKLKHQNYAGGAEEYCKEIEKVKELYTTSEEVSDSEFFMCFISEYFYKRYSWVDSFDANKYSLNELTAVWDEDENMLMWHAYCYDRE